MSFCLKQFLSVFLFLLLQLQLIFSCLYCEGKGARNISVKLGGTYHIPITTDITSLDPISGQLYSWTIGSQIYEGLVTYSKDESKIIPLLAESFAVSDSLLTFSLRKGVRFHDDPCFPGGKGREFTAADVKFSFERATDKGQRPDRLFEAILGYEDMVTGKTAHLEGLRVPGKYIFEIQLTKPAPDLLNYLTDLHMFIVPKEAVDYYGEDFKLHPVGTGPFRFSEIVPNEKLILVKNEHYWGVEDNVRIPYLDAVEYVLYLPGESEKMLLDFQTGKLDECTEDVAKHLSGLVESAASGTPVFKGWLKENGVQYVKDKLFRKLRYIQADGKDRKVRQAMSFAINRERLLESKSQPFQNYEVARGPIPPNCQYFDEHLNGQFYDPDRARALLKETGYPEGHGLPEYLFLSRPGKEFDLIVEDLRAVGFRIKKSDFFPGWREYLDAKERSPLLLRMTNTNTGVEAPSVFGMFLNQPYCLEDTAFVVAFDAWQKNEDSIKNKVLINRLEEIIADITPVIFLYHIDGEFRLLQRYVRGRQLGNAWGHKLHYVWLDH